MVVSERDYIENEVIKNLLSAHREIAGRSEPKQVIKLSNYILKLAKKRKDELLNVRPEEDEANRGRKLMQKEDKEVENK